MTEGTSRRSRAGDLLLALALALALVVHVPALRNGFTFDDHAVVTQNSAVTSGDVGDILRSPYWPDRPGTGLYRPWTTLSFALDWRIGGGRAWPFHATNLILHVIVVGLVFGVARLARRDGGITGGLAALLFAVHPLHTEAVLSVVGRAELWAAVGSLSALLCALHYARSGRNRTLAASAGAFAMALLSKESAAGLALLPIFYAALPASAPVARLEDAGATGTSRTRWVRLALAWFGVGIAALLARRLALGAWIGLAPVSLMDNPLAHAPVLERFASAAGFLWVYALRFFLPVTLSADYSYPQLVPSWGWTIAGFAWFIALTCAFALVRRDRFLLFALVWMCVTGLVTANLLLPIGTVLAERLAYLPTAGPIWMAASVGAALLLGARRGRRSGRPVTTLVVSMCVLLITAGAARSWLRGLDWRDDLALFGATIRSSPRSGKAHTNLAVAQLKAGDLPSSLASGRRALALAPGYSAAEAVVGSALFQQGELEAALPHLRRGARTDPARAPEPALELGNLYLALGREASADSVFRALAAVLGPQDRRVWIGLASSAALGRRWSDSVRAWQNAVALEPTDRAARRAWAYALWQGGERTRADSLYAALLDEAPNDAETLNDVAWFLAVGNGEPERAVGLAARAYALHPTSEVADTFVEAMLRAGRTSEALDWIRHRTELSSDARELLFARLTRPIETPSEGN